MLFDCKRRVRTEPLRRGEQLFAFYDATAGAAYRAYRRLLNKWIGKLPKEDRVDTLGRMRKGDNLQFRHAFAEVVIHAALGRGGFAVTVHPPLSGRNEKPDFLAARQDGRKAAYLEVISFSPTSEEQKQNNRSGGCRLDHAVQIEPGLRPQSPKNGSFSNVRLRLSSISV
jgi:hypothetical protein